MIKDVFYEHGFSSNVYNDLEEKENRGRESLRRLRLNKICRKHEKKGGMYIKYKYVRFLDHMLILFRTLGLSLLKTHKNRLCVSLSQ